eukprot:6112672-Pyramimonas_sp.AAC.1
MAQYDLTCVCKQLCRVNKRRVTPEWCAPIELWDMALNHVLGIPAKKEVGGVGAPDPALTTCS